MSESRFIYSYGVITVLNFIWLYFGDSSIQYAFQVVPNLLLLYYWIKNDGLSHKLMSAAWIAFTLTDLTSAFLPMLDIVNGILVTSSLLLLILAFYTWRTGYTKRRMYLALIAVAYGIGYFMLIKDLIPEDLKISIAVYASLDAIIFVVIAGMQLKSIYSYVLCLFGVFLYVVTDGLFAYHYLVEELVMGDAIIGTLHALCLGLFVLGVVAENKTSSGNQTGSTSKKTLTFR